MSGAEVFNLISVLVATIAGAVGTVSYVQTVLQRARRKPTPPPEPVRGATLHAGSPTGEPLRGGTLEALPSPEELLNRSADAESVGRLRLAVRTELRDERRSTFWSNFLTNLATNFIVGLVFFVLGVVTTLLISQPH